MKTVWILGIGCAGLLTALTLRHAGAHNCRAGAHVRQLAMAAGASGCGDHAAGAACAAPAKDNPRAAAVAGAGAKDKDKVLKPQTTCPVMKGGAIDPDLYVDHEGKRIHVCCAGCTDAVKADPAKAIATLAEQGQAPRQALCPIMGKPIDAGQYVDHAGKRIYVCCAGCIDRVKADPEAALAKLREQGVAPAKAGDEPDAAKPEEHKHHHQHQH